jgi:hypothetical protein
MYCPKHKTYAAIKAIKENNQYVCALRSDQEESKEILVSANEITNYIKVLVFTGLTDKEMKIA